MGASGSKLAQIANDKAEGWMQSAIKPTLKQLANGDAGVAVKTNVLRNRRMIAELIREYSLAPAREAGESQVELRTDGGPRTARRAGSFYRSDRKFDLRQELKKWL